MKEKTFLNVHTGKKFIKWLRHSLGKPYHFLVTNNDLAMVFGGLSAIYIAVYEFKADKWLIFKNNLTYCELIYKTIIIISCGLIVLRAYRSKTPKRFDERKKALAVLIGFTQTVGSIVQSKIMDFSKTIPTIKPRSDKFQKITNPLNRISIISKEMVGFLKTHYDLEEDQINITIMENPPNQQWKRLYAYQSWNTTTPTELMQKKSAISYCVSLSEPIYFNDKVDAAKEDKYFLSQRDMDKKTGSIYVHPLTFETPKNLEVNYLISVVTYQKQLSDDYDIESTAVTKILLKEFIRRYEIELCLHTIKTRI